MDDINFNKYSNKKPYNDLPFPEDQHLAPFFIHGYDEVKAMNYNRDNLETWHFSGVPVLVGFVPVTKEQFPGTMKLFWSDVRTYIKELAGDPNVISYDKFLEDAESEDGNGYDPAQVDSIEDTVMLGLIIDWLIREVGNRNARYGHILQLIKEEYAKGEIIDILLKEEGIKKTQAYAEIRAAQKLAKELYNKD